MKAKRRRRLRPLLFVIPVVFGALSGLTCDVLVMARERARRSRCNSNLVISNVCHLYASDFGGYFPPDLGYLYPDGISDGEVFLCPSAGRAISIYDDPGFSVDKAHSDPSYMSAAFGDTHTDYVYVSGLTSYDPHTYILIFDDEWNHDGEGINVCTVGLGGGWTSDIMGVHEQLARQEKELAAKGRKMKVLRPAWSSWPDPPADPRPWYARRGGRAVLVGVIAAVALALPLIIRTVRRGRNRPAEGD